MTESGSPGPGGLPGQQAGDVGQEILSLWQTPVPDVKLWHVPVFLLPRLAEMAAEVPDTSLGRKIYRYRSQSLASLACDARRTNVSAFQAAEPPSSAEQRLGRALSNAFYQECSLADIMLASGLSAEQVVAIGKRTIRRRKWLRKLTELNPGLAFRIAD